MFTISLKVGDVTYKGKGATALEALQNTPRPEKIMLKGIMTINKGKKSKTLLFAPSRLKHIFYPSAQPIIIKWLAQDLK